MGVRGSSTELILELHIFMFALVRVRAKGFNKNAGGHQITELVELVQSGPLGEPVRLGGPVL